MESKPQQPNSAQTSSHGPSSQESLPEGWVHIPGVYRGPDRRKRPTPMLSFFLFWGRREKNLSGPQQDYFTDRMTGSAWMFFWITFVLSTIDGAFSVYYILHKGFVEVNPVLAPLIQRGGLPFLLGKYVFTLWGLTFLIVHQHFRVFRAIVSVVLVMYGALCAYHIFLFYKLHV